MSATTTTLELEMNTDMSAARFPIWMALSIFSAVALAAVTSTSEKSERESDDKWVLSVCIISMSLSFIATAAYLFGRSLFVGQKPEAVMITAVLGFWGAGLPTIMNPNNGIAVAGISVINANLYFFSWLSFAAVLFLSGSLAQETAGVDVTKTPPKSARWYGLCASSLVVMGSAVRIFKAGSCGDDVGTEFCKRTKFAVSVGVVSFVFSMVLTYLTQKGLTIMLETIATMVLLIMWCFGTGYITFGSSPGAQIGNLYFATWISFILCVFLFGQCFRDVLHARSANATEQSSSTAPTSDEPQAFPEVPADDDINLEPSEYVE